MRPSTDLSSVHPLAGSAISRPSTSLPQHQRPHVPLKGVFSTHPSPRQSSAPSPAIQKGSAGSEPLTSVSPQPALYTWDEGPRDMPGTAAYYKSWTFRKKVNAGTNMVAGERADHSEDTGNSADESYGKKLSRAEDAKSLVMIFSRTNARRASTQRKVHSRMQKANRRMKLWRKLEGAQCFFDWD